jgi:UDP-3-O-[3-hydroxymyristoyl] glucosamine N-acyltransferase
MIEPRFFPAPTPLDLAGLLAATDATAAPQNAILAITGIAALDQAGPADLALVGDEDAPALSATRAGACLLAPAFLDRVPAGTVALVTPEPSAAFARAAAALFPSAAQPQPVFGAGVAPGAIIHPDARLEPDVAVDPGAVIGPRAEIGRGSVICANAVIGPDVRIGRGSAVGAGAAVLHAFVGDRVVLQAGVRIGQAGSAVGGHDVAKAAQVGRVIVQDGVEIGANAAIDRGADRDTVIGEGTKIDNLVQIGHNVVIGRHCLIAAHVALAGSVTLGDFVALGGHVGIARHVRIGAGARIAASSHVSDEVPAGAHWGGAPARPLAGASGS